MTVRETLAMKMFARLELFAAAASPRSPVTLHKVPRHQTACLKDRREVQSSVMKFLPRRPHTSARRRVFPPIHQDNCGRPGAALGCQPEAFPLRAPPPTSSVFVCRVQRPVYQSIHLPAHLHPAAKRLHCLISLSLPSPSRHLS